MTTLEGAVWGRAMWRASHQAHEDMDTPGDHQACPFCHAIPVALDMTPARREALARYYEEVLERVAEIVALQRRSRLLASQAESCSDRLRSTILAAHEQAAVEQQRLLDAIAILRSVPHE